MSDTVVTGGGPALGVSPVGLELHEQFNNAAQQRHAATMGMFIWLITELLLFAGLFLVALILRITHPASVTAAAKNLKFWLGATNTVLLICSSLTMSGAIELSRMGWQRGMVRCMLATAGLGSLFIAIKGYEYFVDWQEHMVPFFIDRQYALAGDSASELFVNLYFATTGLHGLHLITGVSILLVLAWQASAPGYLSRHQNRIEIYGLYWIIVFPILYVFNR